MRIRLPTRPACAGRRVNPPAWKAVRTSVALGMLAGLPAMASPATAQNPEPLRKSDVVRLLTSGAYGQGEIAGIIRRACLTFRPTSRDLAHFRTLGATADVMEAVRECGSRTAEGGGAPPPAAPVQPAGGILPGAETPARAEFEESLTLFVSPRRPVVRPGDTLRIVAEVTRGAMPVGGVRLELRRTEDGGVVASARTDGRGVAAFEVPVGEPVPAGPYTVMSPDLSLEGEGLVEVRREGEEAVEGAAEAAAAGERISAADERGEAEGEGAPQAPAPEPPLEEESPTDRFSSVGEALREAERLSLEGRYGEATEIYEAFRDERPEDVDVLVAYGIHLARMGRHAEAGERLQRALTLAPERSEVRRALGRLSLWRGDVEEAVRWFRTATEVKPDDVEAWRGLGEALLEAGRREEARRVYRRVRELEGRP